MNEVANCTKHKRYAWVAVLLSLIAPGLGHIYCGMLLRGLVLALAYGISVPLIAWILAYCSPVRTAVFLALGLVCVFGVITVAMIDAYRVSRRTRSSYALKDYNRWYVYVLLGLITLGSACGYSLFTRGQFLEAFIVPSCSMYPTIYPGDRALANKIAYDLYDPVRGDLIVFRSPVQWRQNHIKRIVAVAGDTVEIKNGDLYVNDQKLERQTSPQPLAVTADSRCEGAVSYEINGNSKYLIAPTPSKSTGAGDFAKITIPQYHCFVLGDNRNYSRDSRHYGPIPLASIIGRFDYIYWPSQGWSRFGRLNRR